MLGSYHRVMIRAGWEAAEREYRRGYQVGGRDRTMSAPRADLGKGGAHAAGHDWFFWRGYEAGFEGIPYLERAPRGY